MLSDEEVRRRVAEVERAGRAFIALLHELGGTSPTGERFGDRHLALANTHIEDAMARAIGSITKAPPGPGYDPLTDDPRRTPLSTQRIEHPDSSPTGVTVPVLETPKPLQINVMGGVAVVPGVSVAEGGAKFTPLSITFPPPPAGPDKGET